MACPTGRCALRRFDGHGTPYKQTNTAASKQMADSLARMMAERELQDAGVFQRNSKNVVLESPVALQQSQKQQQLQQQQQQSAKYYNLSD